MHVMCLRHSHFRYFRFLVPLTPANAVAAGGPAASIDAGRTALIQRLISDVEQVSAMDLSQDEARFIAPRLKRLLDECEAKCVLEALPLLVATCVLTVRAVLIAPEPMSVKHHRRSTALEIWIRLNWTPCSL